MHRSVGLRAASADEELSTLAKACQAIVTTRFLTTLDQPSRIATAQSGGSHAILDADAEQSSDVRRGTEASKRPFHLAVMKSA